jgi:type IV pilus assembly protein PilM
VAVRRQQVEILYAACQMAGLKLAAVEIEPLALLRVLGQDYRQQDLMALLHIGASRSHFSVFNNGILVFYRFLSFGCAPFFRGLGDAVPNDNINMGYIELNQDSEYDFLVRDMIAEVSRSIEYFNMQSGGKIGAVETILLCGGGTRIKGLNISLEEGLGLGVVVVNPLENIILNPDTTDADKNKLKHDFAVALGLAARRSI